MILGGVALPLGGQSGPADPLDPERVQAFVAAGHNDLDEVRRMLAKAPSLLYAAHDWGGGDFETALEGAGHVGNRPIAEYLIGQGARPNIFVLCMLGREAIVRAQLAAFPDLLNALGPHGFTLLHHARVGGEPAAPLVEFLLEQGLEEGQLPLPNPRR